MTKYFENAPALSVTLTEEQLKTFAKEVAEATISAMGLIKEEESTWLSSGQVCSRLNITRATLWRWESEGYLPGTRFGRRLRFKESDVCRVEAAEKGGEE